MATPKDPSGSRDPAAAAPKDKPVRVVRIRNIRGNIWANRLPSGDLAYNVTFDRLYRERDETDDRGEVTKQGDWKQSQSGSIPEKWRLVLGLDSIASDLSVTQHPRGDHGDPQPIQDRPQRPSPGGDPCAVESATRCRATAVARSIEPGPRQFRATRSRDPRPLPSPRRPDDRQPPGRSHDPAGPGRAWNKGGAARADRSRRSPQTRRLRLRLLGGLTVWIATIYWGPRSHTGRGRGREGTGAYPELAALGIRKGATPALHSQVGRLTALLPSIELARDELRHQGLTFDEKTVHRMVRQLGAEVLATRTRDLQRFRDGQLPAGQEMSGQHVVAQVDGGRVRIRTQVETKKRKGVKYRRKIRVEWREPKLLILYLSDRKGRMLRGTRPWIDGTLNGPDHLMELLAFHLHRWGAARAKAVSFVSDGAPWIWNRLEWVVGRAGLDPKRTERVLDCYHATHHISLALQALGVSEEERTATYRTLRHQLRAGRSRAVVSTLRTMAEGQPLDSGVWTEIEYLDKHEAHLRYDWFGYRGRPLGSGAVESAIRRVINLRLKGNGISWREENAEAMLVLRAAVLTGVGGRRRWKGRRRRWRRTVAATGSGRLPTSRRS